MAVIKEVPGIEVTITVDDDDLPEYDEPIEDEDLELFATVTKGVDSVSAHVTKIPHVVKYVEAVSDAMFTFKLVKHAAFNHRSHHIAWGAYYDGHSNQLDHEPFKDRNKRWVSEQDGFYETMEDGHFQQNFKFGDLTIVEQKKSNRASRAKHLGTLCVKVYHMNFTCRIKNDSLSSKVYEEAEVAEKHLKGRAITQTVRYTTPEPISLVPRDPEDVYHDPSKKPFAIFEFRYRSKEGLIQEGILPRPTVVDGMTYVELRRFALELHHERERFVNSEAIQVKQEGGVSDALYRGRKRSGTAGGYSSTKRYKESTREDGATEVDLEESDDNEEDRVEIDLTD